MLNSHNKTIGNIGENIVLKHYLNKNYVLLSKNSLFKGGEIDIILQKDSTIYFIEVKTVLEDKIKAIDNFTNKKAKNMHRAIEIFLYKNKDLKYNKIQINLACVTLKNYNTYNKYIDTEDYSIEILENIILE